jgi:hypothetical protein
MQRQTVEVPLLNKNAYWKGKSGWLQRLVTASSFYY